jgi:hypothetical protein
MLNFSIQTVNSVRFVKKKFFLIAILAIILIICLGVYYFIVVYPQGQTLPDGKGFIPLQFNFENDIRNITVSPDTSTNVKMTLISNLDKEIRVTIKTNIEAFDWAPWFNAAVQPNAVILKAYGANSTTLTVDLTEETPPDIQPLTLNLELESAQYLGLGLWSRSLQIYVKSP